MIVCDTKQCKHDMGQVYSTLTLSAQKRITGYHFFVFPDSSGAQLGEPKLVLTKRTKIENYIQFADQKGAARVCCVILWRFITTKVL